MRRLAIFSGSPGRPRGRHGTWNFSRDKHLHVAELALNCRPESATTRVVSAGVLRDVGEVSRPDQGKSIVARFRLVGTGVHAVAY